jgi:hypothetical protein
MAFRAPLYRASAATIVGVRIVICGFAALAVACSDAPTDSDPYCGNGRPDPDEECDVVGDQYCTANCTLQRIEVVAHWSFETLSGDLKAPCLPGDPDVQVHVQGITGYTGYGAVVSSPCVAGQTPVAVKPGAFNVWVSSVTDHEYRSDPFFIIINGPRDLPTSVAYTDAGYVTGRTHYTDADGRARCAPPNVESIHFVVDGARSDSPVLCNSGLDVIGPFSAGMHTLRADGYDAALNVIATSAPVDINIVAGGTLDVGSIELYLL